MIESTVQTEQAGVAVLDQPVENDAAFDEDEAVLAEFLVEEVSIDGMCGVY